MPEPSVTDALPALVEDVSPLIVRIAGGGRNHRASGLRWSSDGLVVTTASAVGRQGQVLVNDGAGHEVEADVVGRDPGTDVALLRVPDPQPIHELPRRPSDGIRVGQWALALGRPGRSVRALVGVVGVLGGEVHTMAGGRIDAWIELDRSLPASFLGGSVVGLDGHLMGMVSFAGARGGALIPTQTLNRVVNELARHGSVPQGYIGVAVHPVRFPADKRQAVVVVGLDEGGPAHQAGLLVGDVLIGIEGHPIDSPITLRAALADKSAQRVRLRLLRGGNDLELELQPVSRS